MRVLATFAVTWLLPLRAFAWTNGQLMIWMDPDRAPAVRQIAQQFGTDWGIKVEVETPEDVRNNFPIAAQSSKGPDIVIFAHDKIGEWADSGLIVPIDVSARFREQFFPKAWEAVNHRKHLWGYPLSFEVVSLIYNKKLVGGAPPSQLRDLIAFNEQFRKKYPDKMSILWNYSSAYYSWGILASAGAYIYAKTDEGYDLKNVGVACRGAVAALTQICNLVHLGILPRGAPTSMDPKALMAEGKLAMMLSGPWDWPDLMKNGIDFGVAPVPGVDGHPGKAFVGVNAAYLSRSSPNEDLAKEFLEHYLITGAGLTACDKLKPIGVPALISLYNQMVKTDPLLASMKNCADKGEVMPNIPQMGKFWSAIGPALQLATNGQTTPQVALDDAARNMLR